jgi:hypothetical protein
MKASVRTLQRGASVDTVDNDVCVGVHDGLGSEGIEALLDMYSRARVEENSVSVLLRSKAVDREHVASLHLGHLSDR